MNQATKPKFPPNPYRRSPIKKREDLAGRAREQKTIRYYLSLTASGQSPHLALIGQRGVGKTSLLNGAESIAKDLKLLPVRLDMNELKAKSPGRFWHDLYQTLSLSMVKAGCWGGVQGTIYAELLRMMHARQPGSLEKAVMQIPYVFSCNQGSIDSFDCPDALVVNDFEACLTELQSKGLTGIVLLIDEADCLGKNVPLLQMFRNIFQVVEHCSLLLAGTETVFPALSEVFSPIPRQFHRVEVKPFSRWLDTMELVLHPIPKDMEAVAPERDVVEELHELCGGAPDEIQLYCHHMYRSVEDGTSVRMALSPSVFREVLREYRTNTPANVEGVLNAIEQLPDKLLYESKWLSRRNLTREENIRITVLRRELRLNKTISVDERSEIARGLAEGYRKLFDAGITEIDNRIRLVGAPLTAGFWKSFVKVERSKRWIWNDDSFADNLGQSIMYAIWRACGAVGQLYLSQAWDAVIALQALREGKVPAEFDEGMAEMIASALFAHDQKITHAVDIAFQIGSPAGKQTSKCRFFEKHGQELRHEQFQEWIENHHALLAGNDISIVITDYNRWELPSPIELRRLGRISGYLIPDEFGPTELEQAFTLFENGDIQGCMAIFSRMLVDKESAHIRNNLAFCQLLTGDVAIGLENATKASATEYTPLHELNRGIGEFLQGNTDTAKASLHSALQQLRAPGSKFDVEAAYVLVLDSAEKKANSHAELPVDAAILINLHRMGEFDKTELEKELVKLYPNKAPNWVVAFTAPL
jgi:hypothetical protein